MSYSLKYYPDPGIAFDISKMLFVKLNPESVWKSLLTSIEDTTLETLKIQHNSNQFPNPNSILLLFLFIPSNKRETLLTQIIKSLFCKDISNFTLEKLISYFNDLECISQDLYSFYLGESITQNTDMEQIIRNRKTIPDKIKLLLFGYIMNPSKYISSLVQTINEYSNLIMKTFISVDTNYYTFDLFIDSLLQKNDISNHIVQAKLQQKTIHYSICYTIPDFLCHFLDSDTPFLIAAIDTIHSYDKSNFNDTALLLTCTSAISDTSRLSLIQLLRSSHPLTMKEISKALCLSQTATYNHISILKDANMLSVSHSGRTLYYSYNPEGIETIIKILTNLHSTI